MVLLIGNWRLVGVCVLTYLVLYLGLILSEEEFLSQNFKPTSRFPKYLFVDGYLGAINVHPEFGRSNYLLPA